MAYLEFPLSNFIGHSEGIIETLYTIPENFNLEERDDTDLVMNLKPIESYNPTRHNIPSVIWDKEFEPIFGCDNVCMYDPYYILYLKLIDYIIEKFEEDGEFKYCIDNDSVYELNHKNDVKDFLAHIIQTVPCSLYEIKNNLNIS